ncbi:branched-chain amino acid uptake carrier [Schinkia azotoformans MEV2011]|uniref:Branched-chain amino acid transport system carrier protein n=1 Tax=Schinkia azotoformans MEV2011 TaxID=1348973 RepID=A0A072NNK1_SCHAZ|nr:branched-chain amino acid transport system II carrier protein [Schinkia azotoformans]KEF39239.1 branched-chain amino acid uptake carrier [Schinkia azotoformans MEV2011]MEC1695904.1 branched-chain amino acid transport system II carrier protein [Schinkia azotoformans]MEC1717033.1 branched-chain amino acid transport system II carrier protein [Schinkia azotoformans]MEC1721722.1 branched-chain amino acid transport system II carrier protein [Schinkia azotoformans]MEC1726060.1 branched-chain amino
MASRNSFSFVVSVGFMLFALFFGAGNLIFPVMLGQMAGENVWAANAGFIVTGVGLPVLGVLALGFSGKNDLQSLASRVHPIYGILFTCALYLSIGPLFAIPRTATVSYEIGIKPFFGDNAGSLPLLIFSIVFFAITLFFSLKSSKLVDIVGKVLTPILLLSIAVLIVAVFLNPIGEIQAPTENYLNNAFFKGFQEGYLTMDALAAFVFGIIIINTMKNSGAVTKKEIMTSSLKVALIAGGLLAAIYSSLAFMGATSASELGMLDNGGAILAAVSAHYFGSYGNALLSIIVIAACLTTSIGLITSCAAYFNKLVPSISYTRWAIIFTLFSTVIANFGLSTLISISVPVLVALYPLAICLLVLTFLHPLFKGKKAVYQVSMLLTGIVSVFDGLNAAGIKVQVINDLFTTILPLYSVGLGWILPAIIGGLVGLVINAVKKADYQVSPVENN